MHHALALRYIELQALMLAVVAPHWAETIWLEVLSKPTTIQLAQFPQVAATDAALTAAREYVRTTSSNITSAEGAQVKRMQKGKATQYDPKQDKRLAVFCASGFPAWQEQYIEIVRRAFDGVALDMKAVSKSIPKQDSKKAMPFVQGLKRSLDNGVQPDAVFERKMAFDEVEVLREMMPGLRQSLQRCVAVEVLLVEDGGKAGQVVGAIGGSAAEGERKEGLAQAAEGAMPGQPTFFFENI